MGWPLTTDTSATDLLEEARTLLSCASSHRTGWHTRADALVEAIGALLGTEKAPYYPTERTL